MSLEIHIHHTSGKITRLEQKDSSRARQLLKQVSPAKVFAEAQLVLAGGGLITVVATAHITRLDFITNEPLDWSLPANATAMLVLPDFSSLRARAAAHPVAGVPGEPLVAHLAYDLAGGERLYTEVRAKAGHPFEARSKINRLLANPPLQFSLAGGGATILNPANVIRVVVSANSAKQIPGVWPAELRND
jgi:hypothetical protein